MPVSQGEANSETGRVARLLQGSMGLLHALPTFLLQDHQKLVLLVLLLLVLLVMLLLLQRWLGVEEQHTHGLTSTGGASPTADTCLTTRAFESGD